ncbi:MAG: hypothetical protein ACRCUP_07915 [Mycoplasmatales bacterium]
MNELYRDIIKYIKNSVSKQVSISELAKEFNRDQRTIIAAIEEINNRINKCRIFLTIENKMVEIDAEREVLLEKYPLIQSILFEYYDFFEMILYDILTPKTKTMEHIEMFFLSNRQLNYRFEKTIGMSYAKYSKQTVMERFAIFKQIAQKLYNSTTLFHFCKLILNQEKDVMRIKKAEENYLNFLKEERLLEKFILEEEILTYQVMFIFHEVYDLDISSVKLEKKLFRNSQEYSIKFEQTLKKLDFTKTQLVSLLIDEYLFGEIRDSKIFGGTSSDKQEIEKFCEQLKNVDLPFTTVAPVDKLRTIQHCDLITYEFIRKYQGVQVAVKSKLEFTITIVFEKHLSSYFDLFKLLKDQYPNIQIELLPLPNFKSSSCPNNILFTSEHLDYSIISINTLNKKSIFELLG